MKLVVLIRWILAAVVLITVLGFYKTTDDHEIRYLEYRQQKSMIYGQEGPINLATIGSSRSMRVFNATELENQVKKTHNMTPIIYDLSRSWPDLGHMTVFVEDAIKNRDIDMVLVEYKEHQNNFERHPYFPLTAPVTSVISSVQASPSKNIVNRIHTLTRDLFDRAQIRLSALLSGKVKRDKSPALKPAKTTDPSPTWFKDASRLEKYADQKKDTWKDDGYRYIDTSAPEEERNSYFVKRLVKTAKENDVYLAFYYIPRMYDMPFSAEFIEEFDAEYGATLIQLPLKELEGLYPDGYTDPTHPGDQTMKVYMKHLAEVLPWKPLNE